MSAKNSAYSWQGDKLVLQIFLQSLASQNEFCERHNDLIRLRVTAPRVENQSNSECMKFLAKPLKTKKTNLSLVLGQTSRAKLFKS